MDLRSHFNWRVPRHSRWAAPTLILVHGGNFMVQTLVCTSLIATQSQTSSITNFVVYRRNGPGNVVVGDVIALHYPKDSGKWFSMWKCKPQLAPCPGAPSSADGMSNDVSWYSCNGEAFKIYARNKKLGDAIVAHDDVKLYYLGEGKMLNVWNNNCDGVVNPSRPPPSNSYTYLDTLEICIAWPPAACVDLNLSCWDID